MDELIEYSNNPQLKSSQYHLEFQELRKRKTALVLQILEYLTADYVDQRLLKLRETWGRIKTDIQQTEVAITHIDELDRLGTKIEGGIATLMRMLGAANNQKINLSILYASKPVMHHYVVDEFEELVLEYFKIIEPSNHREIFEEEYQFLQRFYSLLDPSIIDHEVFSTRNLHSLSRRFKQSRSRTIEVLSAVKSSLLNHRTDITHETQQTRSTYIKLMKKLLATDVYQEKLISTPVVTSQVSILPNFAQEIPSQLKKERFFDLSSRLETKQKIERPKKHKITREVSKDDESQELVPLADIDEFPSLNPLSNLLKLVDLQKKYEIRQLEELN
ncbi:MAG: hypothetical protein ACXAD7_06615 [Candidatus Kariarchaeaceae archaeon]